MLSLPAWLLVTAIAAVCGGLATSGTASVILTGQRPVGAVVARVGAVAGAAVVLLAGLTAAALQVPALAPAFLTLMGALQVLVMVVAVSFVALLASSVGGHRGRPPRRSDPAVNEALPAARAHGSPRPRAVTVGTLVAAPGRVDDNAALVDELLTTQHHVLITGAADEQLYRRYRALGFQPTTTGRRGLVRTPGPLTPAQAAFLDRLRRTRLDGP